MSYEDKWLKCTDCGDEFLHDAKDQEFFAKKNYTDPKRCRACRAARKSGANSGQSNRK